MATSDYTSDLELRLIEVRDRLQALVSALGLPLPILPAVSLVGVPIAIHASPTVTNTSTTILAANADRRRCVIFNNSGAIVYIKFGLGAATDSFSFRLANNEVYQGPLGCYTGLITAVRTSGSGPLQVTEITI